MKTSLSRDRQGAVRTEPLPDGRGSDSRAIMRSLTPTRGSSIVVDRREQTPVDWVTWTVFPNQAMVGWRAL